MANQAGSAPYSYIKEVQSKAMDALSSLRTAAQTTINDVYNKPAGVGLSLDTQIQFMIPQMPSDSELSFSLRAYYSPLSMQASRSKMWLSDPADKIGAAIQNIIATGGNGFSQATQDAIFNTDRERRQQSLRDALDMAAAGMGARGFSIPNDMLQAQRMELMDKYMMDDAQQSREIQKLMADHARQNIMFAIQSGISLEDFQAQFASRYDRMFIDMTVAALQKYTTEIEAEVRAYEARIKGVLARVDAAKSYNETAGIGARLMLEQYQLEISNELNNSAQALQGAEIDLRNYLGALTAYANAAAELSKSMQVGDYNINMSRVSS